MFVAAGAFFYYYFTFNRIKFDNLEDVLVFTILLIISFLFTLPTTLSLYGYHFRVLNTSLASLEDEGSWTEAIKRYNRQKKILYWIFGTMLFIGLILLVYLILL